MLPNLGGKEGREIYDLLLEHTKGHHTGRASGSKKCL
jgi:hypothetical protein